MSKYDGTGNQPFLLQYLHVFVNKVYPKLHFSILLFTLAKSEASTLLAVKQAAFIRNPDYPGASSGPDIITIGTVVLLVCVLLRDLCFFLYIFRWDDVVERWSHLHCCTIYMH